MADVNKTAARRHQIDALQAEEAVVDALVDYLYSGSILENLEALVNEAEEVVSRYRMAECQVEEF